MSPPPFAGVLMHSTGMQSAWLFLVRLVTLSGYEEGLCQQVPSLLLV